MKNLLFLLKLSILFLFLHLISFKIYNTVIFDQLDCNNNFHEVQSRRIFLILKALWLEKEKRKIKNN